MVNIETHQRIDHRLCGRPLSTGPGVSRIEMETTAEMMVDAFGLVHGGFIFGLADHAAMLAVNHPNVVLGAAEVKFLKPVKSGEQVVAEARVESGSDRKKNVAVTVRKGGEMVFSGTFTCFVLDRHVLA
ncbi:MAG: hotdog domain-containing protein [Desulfobacterales bacterium]